MKRCKEKVLSGDSRYMLAWYVLSMIPAENCTVYFLSVPKLNVCYMQIYHCHCHLNSIYTSIIIIHVQQYREPACIEWLYYACSYTIVQGLTGL